VDFVLNGQDFEIKEKEKEIKNLKQIAVHVLIKSLSIATTFRLIKFGLTVPLIVA
jgi:hypothetical protein